MVTPEVPSERENKSLYSDIENHLSGRIGANPDQVYVNLIEVLLGSRISVDTRYILLRMCFMISVPRNADRVSGVAILLWTCLINICHISHSNYR